MGGRHLENLAAEIEGAHPAAVMDANVEHGETVAGQIGVTFYDDPSELIRSREVDAVIVASPDETHAALTLECIAAGKPVLCEKPLAVDLEDAVAVLRAERDHGSLLVQVGFMRVYDPAHTAVKRAIGKGVIGRPLLLRGWHRTAGSQPRSTASVMIQSAIHDLHSARWLLESEIAEIEVLGMSHQPEGPLSLQAIMMRMANGVAAMVEVNAMSGYGYDVGVEVVGSEGVVTTEPPPATQDSGVWHPEVVHRDWLERFQAAYVAELRAWIASLHGGPPGPGAWDGYATLAAAHAGLRSLEQGRQTVQVPES